MKTAAFLRARVCLYLFILSISVCSNVGTAQVHFEAGITAGPSNFLGDLGGNFGHGMPFLKDNNIQMTRIMKGAYLGFSPHPAFNFRLAVNIGRLEGADSIIRPAGGHELTRMERNLHFRSPLQEVFLVAEFYPTVFRENDWDDVRGRIRPYVLAGIGAFKFNPQAQYRDTNGDKVWVDLKPLRTEGQGMPSHPDRKEYALTQLNIPYGFGIKYFVNDRLHLSFEIVSRMTFTDYIDDVSRNYIPEQAFQDYFGAGTFQAELAHQMANLSNLSIQSNTRSGFMGWEQRGDPKDNDSYYSSSLKIGVRLGDLRNSVLRRATDRTRCPVALY
jgi:hypothetical protein